jgi:hypothetical protein
MNQDARAKQDKPAAFIVEFEAEGEGKDEYAAVWYLYPAVWIIEDGEDEGYWGAACWVDDYEGDPLGEYDSEAEAIEALRKLEEEK